MLLLIAACSGPASSPQIPSTSASGHTGSPPTAPTGHTGHTGTAETDTGWVPPGTPFDASLDVTAQCVDDPYPYDNVLSATSDGGTVAIDFAGEVPGCTCGEVLFAWTAEPATIDLRVGAGDCDLINCRELSGTVSGVPAGDWTVRMRSATATVTVP